mmetsp:Transcript_7847/g.10778  ORF Transcript_7847/g.10778 Transcript_7847/m.10778 type:complete len:119 (+) Transcript_7847:29-385(+)
MLWRRNHTIDMMRGYNRCLETLKMKQKDVETNIGPYSSQVKLPPMIKNRAVVEKGTHVKSFQHRQNYQQRQKQHKEEHTQQHPQHQQSSENAFHPLPSSTQSKNYDKHTQRFNGVDLE